MPVVIEAIAFLAALAVIADYFIRLFYRMWKENQPQEPDDDLQ